MSITRFALLNPADLFKAKFRLKNTGEAAVRSPVVAIQLPEKVAMVHIIRTDDPAGIETYWHTRFADRRKNGEWFELNATDIAAFKRRKFL